MVAEDRLDRYPHTEKPLFTANFEKRNGGTRYHNPNGWRLKREYQLLLTAAFAKLHARADHEQLEASKSKANATKCRSRRK
jgi:hypothetical protein